MEDIARIGFQVETTGLVDAKKKLEDIEPAAKKAETAADKLGKKFGWVKDAQGKWRDEMGKFVPKLKLAENGIGGLDTKISIFGKTLDAVKGNLLSFGAGMLAAFGVGAAAFGIQQMVSTLSNFEYEMSTVAAVSGAVGKELQDLRDTAKEMGATTEFSATQAASGLKLLVQAGYNSAEAISTLPAILNLATTEAMDLGAATEYVNSIMAGFGLGVQDAARVTDVLVYASNAASTGVAELGEGMKYVGPISAALGISIEDTAAAMGLLSDAGLKGGQAGTSLRSSLAALASPTKQAVDELKRLGVAAKDVNPATNSIVSIVDKLANVNLEAASAFKIFGREAAPAFLALIANKDKLHQMTEEMQNVQGEAKRIADYMRDNFKGSLQNLSSALEAVIIALGDAGLTAALRLAVDVVTYFVSTVANVVTAFSSWVAASAPVQAIMSAIVNNANLLKGAIAAVAIVYTASFIPAIYSATAALITQMAVYYTMQGGLAGLAAAAWLAVGGFTTLRGAMIATGFGAIIVALGLIIAKILDLNDKTKSLGTTFGLVWAFIKTSAQSIPAALSAVWSKIKSEFYRFVSDLSYKWADFLTFIKQGADLIGATGMADSLATGPIASAVESGNDSLVKSGESADEVSRKLAWSAQNIKLAYEDMGIQAKLAGMGLKDLNAPMKEVAKTTDDLGGIIPPVTDDLGGMGGAAGGAAEKTKELKTALQLLTEEFQKLTEPFDQATSAFDALEKAKELGIIGNDQYVASLQRVQDAFLKTGGTADQWGKIVGKNTVTVGKQLEDLGKKNVTDLGRSFADLAVDGKANFADLAKGIIKELIAIAWQAMIVKPLLSWLGFADGGTFGGGDALTGALQGAGAPAVQPGMFAKGGAFTNSVVNAPTPFKFAQGGGFGLGVMGEAGPEAVMPLTRGPDGALGVQMYGAPATGGASGGRQSVDVNIHVQAEEGDMFRPVVQAIARDEATGAVVQGMNEMNAQLPDRVTEIVNDPRMRSN